MGASRWALTVAASELLLVVSCSIGVVISWAGLNAQMHISATTMLVVTNLNKFVVVGFGMLVVVALLVVAANPGYDGL
mgnify:CR=1 FL=1